MHPIINLNLTLTHTGVADTGAGMGCAFGDIDNDGDLDLYVANYNQANKLYTNPYGVTSTTLIAKPLTVACAPSVFAPVKLTTNDGSLVAVRALDGGSGYGSQNGYEARFANLQINTEYTISVVLSPSITRTFGWSTSNANSATVVEFMVPFNVCPDGQFSDVSNNYQCQQCPANFPE